MEYVATNIRFPKATLQELRFKAIRQHKSLAQLIRDAVERVYGMPKSRTKSLQEFHKDTIFKIIGICNTGIKDGAREHDRDIYGDRGWV